MQGRFTRERKSTEKHHEHLGTRLDQRMIVFQLFHRLVDILNVMWTSTHTTLTARSRFALNGTTTDSLSEMRDFFRP